MARLIIIIALAVITLNTGILHGINSSLSPHAFFLQDRENPSNSQELFMNLFYNDSITEEPLQNPGACVIRLKKTARVVRSS